MKKRYFFGILLLLLFGGMCRQSNAQTGWDYPVKPGMPEWATFKTHAEMVAAIQIPEDVLRSVTTGELVELCLNYPLLIALYGYNTLQAGFRQNICIHSNGVQELFRRSDNVQSLLSRLKEIDVFELAGEGVLALEYRGEQIIAGTFLELLLSHESVIANASAEQQKEIAALAVRNMTVKEFHPRTYSGYSLESSAFLLCAVLTRMNGGVVPSPALELFQKEGGMFQNAALIIEELKESYVKF